MYSNILGFGGDVVDFNKVESAVGINISTGVCATDE